MKEKEFKEKAQNLIKANGFELVVKDTTPNITYDGIEYFKNVLSFDVVYDGITYMTFYCDNNGKIKKVSYTNRYNDEDEAIGIAVSTILSNIFGKKFNLRKKGSRR